MRSKPETTKEWKALESSKRGMIKRIRQSITKPTRLVSRRPLLLMLPALGLSLRTIPRGTWRAAFSSRRLVACQVFRHQPDSIATNFLPRGTLSSLPLTRGSKTLDAQITSMRLLRPLSAFKDKSARTPVTSPSTLHAFLTLPETRYEK